LLEQKTDTRLDTTTLYEHVATQHDPGGDEPNLGRMQKVVLPEAFEQLQRGRMVGAWPVLLLLRNRKRTTRNNPDAARA
jgi:hypothetical protein